MLSTFRQFIIVIGLICLASTGMAETEPQSGSVSDFLTSDGHFDLEAARQSGFEGSLNLDGFDIRLDPLTGEPLLSPSGVNSAESHPDDIYWHDLGTPDIGLSGTVYALTIYEGDLIAGGDFTSAGGVVCNNIARWDGSSWNSFNSGGGTIGVDNVVRCLTVREYDLIVGGDFVHAGNVDAHGIALWDGDLWTGLGENYEGGG